MLVAEARTHKCATCVLSALCLQLSRVLSPYGLVDIRMQDPRHAVVAVRAHRMWVASFISAAELWIVMWALCSVELVLLSYYKWSTDVVCLLGIFVLYVIWLGLCSWFSANFLVFVAVDRDWLKFGCGFGAETNLKCSFGYGYNTPISHSVSAATIRQTTETGVSELMEDLRHWIGLHTLHRETHFEVKP